MLHVLGDILLVTSADESRRQIVVCPPVCAAGLAVSPCGVTSADERRRQIVVCPPLYAAGLAISPCGADCCGCAEVVKLCESEGDSLNTASSLF